MSYHNTMSQILKEISDWNFGSKMPNHTYLLSDSGKIIAYAPWHGVQVVKLKSGMKLDKRNRKFVKSDHPGLTKVLLGQEPEKNIRKFNVKSKDKEYTVSVEEGNYSCTCLGFNFRGQCKHIAAVAEKLQTA